MKLAVGINTYQDRKGIQRTIESLYDHVDDIIVVDGKYLDWGKPNDPPFSTDGTKEYCYSLDKVRYYAYSDLQEKKRTWYMLQCKCDLLLVADADDYIDESTDWDKFHRWIDTGQEYMEGLFKIDMKQIYNVNFIMAPGRQQTLGRLYYKPYTLRYISHWRVERDGIQIIYPRSRTYVVPGLVMTSNDMLRPKERIPVDIKYQWDLLYKEGSINRERYTNPNEKRRFEQDIWNEAIVWEKYFETH